MKVYHVNLIGRFGNNLFQYAAARAVAERDEALLTTSPWIGEKIFEIEPTKPILGSEVLELGYGQDQKSLIYTRKQAKEWFALRPEIKNELPKHGVESAAHRRVGDYEKLGYVVVSMKSYHEAFRKFGIRPEEVHFITEESPTLSRMFDGELSFLPDFYLMMKAKVLFRGNSSFSWWAATLGDGEVYAPVIERLMGGLEHDCEFVKGNWPRFANLPFVTDLHLRGFE